MPIALPLGYIKKMSCFILGYSTLYKCNGFHVDFNKDDLYLPKCASTADCRKISVVISKIRC